MTTVWIVFRKELVDALRDRRTWMIVLVSSSLTTMPRARPFTTIRSSISARGNMVTPPRAISFSSA